MAEVLNANPAIRSASDLPSRRRQGHAQPLSKLSKGLFASTMPLSADLPDPFSPSSSSGSELSDDDNDAAIEPIDEQEIYGTRHSLFSKALSLHLITPQWSAVLQDDDPFFMHAKLTVAAQTSFPTFQIQNIPSLSAHSPSSISRIFSLPLHFQRGVRRLHSRRLQFSSHLR